MCYKCLFYAPFYSISRKLNGPIFRKDFCYFHSNLMIYWKRNVPRLWLWDYMNSSSSSDSTHYTWDCKKTTHLEHARIEKKTLNSSKKIHNWGELKNISTLQLRTRLKQNICPIIPSHEKVALKMFPWNQSLFGLR